MCLPNTMVYSTLYMVNAKCHKLLVSESDFPPNQPMRRLQHNMRISKPYFYIKFCLFSNFFPEFLPNNSNQECITTFNLFFLLIIKDVVLLTFSFSECVVVHIFFNVSFMNQVAPQNGRLLLVRILRRKLPFAHKSATYVVVCSSSFYCPLQILYRYTGGRDTMTHHR